MIEIVTPKTYQKTIEAVQAALTETVAKQVDEISPTVTVLLRKRNASEDYRVITSDISLDKNRKRKFYELGEKLADVSGYIPVAIILLAEAWGALVPNDEVKKLGGVKRAKEVLDQKHVKDMPNSEEIVMLSALKIDGTGDTYAYKISRNEDETISLQKPEHMEIKGPDDAPLLGRFFVGVADTLIPDDED